MLAKVWKRTRHDRSMPYHTSTDRKGAAAQRKKVNDDENNGIAQLKADGMQVVEKVDGESFRKAVAPAYAQYAKEFGADKIAAIQAVR